MTQNDVLKKIEELKIQYCSFANVNIRSMSMKIEFTDEINPSVQIGNPPILYINPIFFKLEQDRILPILYHEFTHVNDYCTCFLNKSLFDRELIVLLYSEIHATIVELQVATGFSNLNDYMLLTTESVINTINGKGTIGEYMDKGDEILGKAIEQFLTNKTKSNFICFIKELGYAIGRLSFAQKYINSNAISVFNLTKAMDIFGHKIEEIIAIGVKGDLSEKEMVYITNTWVELMNANTVPN